MSAPVPALTALVYPDDPPAGVVVVSPPPEVLVLPPGELFLEQEARKK
jgi:hypothetical protein